jgi:hypothetical protein
MRLSMVFTGQAVLELFRESLADGNLPLVRKTSTQDFNSRVWQRIEEDAMAEFTPRLMTNQVEDTLRAEYDGAICKITVRQMGVPVTYVLRDRKGQVAVDDVLIDQSEEVASMKETMETMIPLRTFREALAQSDLDTLQRHSSADLNRMIWRQADNVPAAGQVAVKHLLAPLSKVEMLPEGKCLVTLGDQSFGCSVLLVTEHDEKVVDDIVLVAGVQPELRARLKTKMREQLALVGPAPDNSSEVMQAGNWQDAPKANQQTPKSAATVEQADFEEFPELPPAAVPLPQSALKPDSQSEWATESEPMDEETETTAPPLFPGGEADLESIPEIKPSDSAFDPPVQIPSDDSPF